MPNIIEGVMANHYFEFKRFTVFHDKCAMKVGTDGVLLGAWTDFGECKSILDVGTGSGLIALMAAQRNTTAQITAVEIDKDAASQARENAGDSPFKDRIEVLGISFQKYASNTDRKFDLLVSNPPFFVNALPSPDAKRTDARHADSLTVTEIFKLSRKLLADKGKISMIYPYQELENIKTAAASEKLYLSRETVVFPTPLSPARRLLLEFRADKPDRIITSELVIESKRHTYTREFTQLVKDFYLYL